MMTSSTTITTPPHLVTKAQRIRVVLEQEPVDLWQLRELSLNEGGLVNDELRCQAWPLLAAMPAAVAAAAPRTPPQQRPSPPPPPISTSSLCSSPPPPTGSHPAQLTPPGTPTRSLLLRPRKQSLPDATHDDDRQDDRAQVELDVARCTWHLLTGVPGIHKMHLMEHKRDKRISRLLRRKQQRLRALIGQTLHRTSLRYYQGYHDVASIVLSTFAAQQRRRRQPPPPNQRSTTMSRWAVAAATTRQQQQQQNDAPRRVLLALSTYSFAHCMQSNFAELQQLLRLCVFPLLAWRDGELHDFLTQYHVDETFCLSWILTWFAHDLRDTELCKRIFDALLVGHALLPIYLVVAMVTHHHNRQELLLLQHEPEVDHLVHQTLQDLPKNSSAYGWKYQPGDGYVSDYDEDNDDDTATLTSGLLSEGDLDVLLPSTTTTTTNGNKLHHHSEHPDVASLTSTQPSCSIVDGGTTTRSSMVPFDDLIGTAIDMMHAVPPRKLTALARKYHHQGQKEAMTSELVLTPNLERLLQGAPLHWTQALSHRRQSGQVARRPWWWQSLLWPWRRRRQTNGTNMSTPTRASSSYSAAVVALGLGTSAAERKRWRQDRKTLRSVLMAVVVTFVAQKMWHLLLWRVGWALGEA